MMCRLRAAEISEQELKQRCADGTMYADFVPIERWIAKEGYWECSGCKCATIKDSAYCPDCGARME